MSALQAAGTTLVGGGPQGRRTPPLASTGIRSLREDYLKPVNRAVIPRNLQLIEERLDSESAFRESVASEERVELKRFHYLFKGGELMPAQVFVAALELGPSETLNGRQMQFDTDVLFLRDHLVMAYKPVVEKIRRVNSKEISELPQQMVLKFARAWNAWESAWLRNREIHAVEALQPLAKAILSLEPLLLSADKERLLPWPRVQHQKAVTMKCLQGFVHELGELAGSVLPSWQRELDHDPRLLLLMDHVLSLRGDNPVSLCLDGLSAAPEVTFPDHQRAAPSSPAAIAASASTKDLGKGSAVDAYAFKLLGTSVGDAAASGRLRADSGNGQAGRAKLVSTNSLGTVDLATMDGFRGAAHGNGESKFAKRAAAHAAELLNAFENVKDLLLSVKSSLEEIDPNLEKDEAFVACLEHFEKAFRRAKRLFLEPGNLA